MGNPIVAERIAGDSIGLGEVEPQVPPLRVPGFPVEHSGVGKLHAAFLTESRKRSHGWSHVQEIRVGMTKFRVVA